MISKLKKNKLIRFICYPIILYRNRGYIQRKKLYKKYNLEALLQMKKALDSIAKPFWLDWGTLLGAYREHDFIAYDFDLDIGMYLADYDERVDKALKEAGFVKDHQFSLDNGKTALECTYSYNGLHIDIFFYQRKDDKMICHHFNTEPNMTWAECLEKHGGYMTYENTTSLFELMDFEFKGEIFKVPNNIEEYLVNYYGKDFMTPLDTKGKMEFDYTYSKSLNRFCVYEKY